MQGILHILVSDPSSSPKPPRSNHSEKQYSDNPRISNGSEQDLIFVTISCVFVLVMPAASYFPIV